MSVILVVNSMSYIQAIYTNSTKTVYVLVFATALTLKSLGARADAFASRTAISLPSVSGNHGD